MSVFPKDVKTPEQRGETMFEMIKKSILAGIGAFVVTEEKVQEVIDDFVQKGKLTQQDPDYQQGVAAT